MTPRVMGSEVLPAACRFSNVVLRVPETSSCKASSLVSYSSWISGVSPTPGTVSVLVQESHRALYLFPRTPRRPFGRLLRRRPGLAGQARATGGRDGGRVSHAAPVDQVVARPRHVTDHPDGRLARAAGIAAAHPGHAVVAAARLGLLDRRYGIRARHRIAQRHAFRHLAPSELAARRLGHLARPSRDTSAWSGRNPASPAAHHWSAGCYSPGSARWMISAGSDATALVALWITLLMICWNPFVIPLS